MVDPVPAADPSARVTLTRGGSAFADGWARIWERRGGRIGVYVLGVVTLGWIALWLTVGRGLPDARSLLNYEPPLPTNVRQHDGKPVYVYARERRVQLNYADYPKLVLNAFISAEDKNFFSHGGIDYLGIVSAMVDNVGRVASGQRARGASTITQQVAKNLLVGNEFSVIRKVKEAILAQRIEAVLTKQQILEIYLNQIPLGRQSFGVQAAARAYFGKDIDQLALHEAAFLATLPKAPETYGREKNADRAIARRAFVLGEMVANDHIAQADADAANARPLGLLRTAPETEQAMGDYFLEEVRRSLIERYGETEAKGRNSVYAGGLWVRTSLDPAMQAAAQAALQEGLLRFDQGKGWNGPVGHITPGADWAARFAAKNIATSYKNWRTAVIVEKEAGAATLGFADGQTGRLSASGASNVKKGGGTAFAALREGDIIVVSPEGGGWRLRNIPEVSGGMVVEHVPTGRVLAMQGGFDARLQSFNRATQAQRQPGSTFKPFVYAAALDGGMTPTSIIMDAPFCVYQGRTLGQKCFKNFGGEGGAGPQTMRWGIEQSRNLMTVRAASQTGMDRVVKLADATGISPPGKPYPKVLAIALGAGETTVAKMVSAYATLANNGRAIGQTMIDFVQDRNGRLIYRADTRPCDRCNAPEYDGSAMPRPPARGRQVIDPMTAYQTVHILEGVVHRGTATVLQGLNRPIFGKTGTTNGPTNVWFVGGSPDIVGGVYLGYDQPRPMGSYAQGGVIAAPVFGEFARVALKDRPVLPFRAAGGVRMVRIDRRTGQKVFGAFPKAEERDSAIIWEAFKPESEPRRSIRQDEVKKAAAPTKARAATTRRDETRRNADADFLQDQGGIY